MRLAILGGTGRTGWLLVNLALAQGHSLRVLARDPARLALMHDDLQVIEGDARQADTVRLLVKGCDAVISALGPVPGEEDICSRATANVITAAASVGPRRYALVSGMAQDLPGDEKSLANRLVSWMVMRSGGAAVADKARECELLLNSDMNYTLLRPPMLTSGPATGQVRFDLKNCPGSRLSRGDLAASLLACVVTNAYLRQAPFLSL